MSPTLEIPSPRHARNLGQSLSSTWSEVGGLEIHARVAVNPDFSARPAIILVHGLGVSSRYMIPTAKRLASDFNVYAPDLPGFGRSDKPARPFDLAKLADMLADWTRSAGLPRSIFLGNSLGCQVIVHFAERHPSLIDRAILVGATVDPQARSFVRQLGRGILDLWREPWSLWPILLGDYFTAGPLRMLHTFAFALQDDVRRHLSAVSVPTLVVRGAGDPICPQRWAEEMVRLLPRGRLAVLPGAAHAATYDDPEELVVAVREFLNRSTN